jgi:hypothetical protein
MKDLSYAQTHPMTNDDQTTYKKSKTGQTLRLRLLASSKVKASSKAVLASSSVLIQTIE